MIASRPGWAAVVFVAGLGAVSAPGCAAEQPAIRVAYAGVADFDMLPSVAAHAALAAERISVDVVHYARSELAVEAVARGDAEFGHGSVRNYWAAAARGAPVRLVMAHTGNVQRLVAHASILHCAALDGRDVAVQSEGAVGTALLHAYLEARCPDALPALLYVPLSANRAAALGSGGVRAAVLKLADAVRLDGEAPDRFRVLADFGAIWGDVLTSGVFVNVAWAERHPNLVRRYIEARIEAHRSAADAEALAGAAADRLGASDHWAAVAQAYVASGAWPADGGATEAVVSRSLAFYRAHGNLPPALDTETAADLSFLDAVLAERPETSPNGAR